MPEDDDVTVRGAGLQLFACNNALQSAIGRGWKNTFLSKTRFVSLEAWGVMFGFVNVALACREEAEANMREVGTTWEWQVT